MWIDELHKFSDGTLIDLRTALDNHLEGIRMKYLPQSIWRKSDKYRAAAMIHAIDKRLKTRRIMRSLERFVGGRLPMTFLFDFSRLTISPNVEVFKFFSTVEVDSKNLLDRVSSSKLRVI
uniref:Uncharacterized protein n=1 Tax=Tanacetum cinerariifolium TaxID=118510 RepID=A0A699JJD8_TANCI|nr:hypothetical protein [Tanacetum cinerariifolium]